MLKNTTFEFSRSFVVIDAAHVANLIKELEDLFYDLRVLSDKGFVNDPTVNLPVLLDLVKYYGLKKLVDRLDNIDNKNKNKKPIKKSKKNSDSDSVFSGSVVLNTICFNFVLLTMYRIVIILEEWFINNPEGKTLLVDKFVDLRTVRRNILIMLHPLIKKKVSARGIHIELNSIVGYDSEYELLSSTENINKLLSIQLAANSYMNVRIPITDKVFDIKDLNIKGGQTIGEKTYILIFKSSIDSMIKEIREMLYNENDSKIAVLDTLLEERLKNKEIRSKIYLPADDCNVYSFNKSEVATQVKILDSYYFKDLIKDAELLNEGNHKIDLIDIITGLNNVCGNKSILSQKMLACIDKSVSKPSSRINLKYNNSKNNISISVTRNLYLCMHETSADLSMLSDFECFKEYFDVVAKSFVTIGKPLKIMDANGYLIGNSRIHVRDTLLLAPMGAKKLADIGKIYGPDYHKIDIGEYRNGNMSALLKDNKDLFIKYGVRDAVITLKHSTMMEEFYFSVCKMGVPLTLSGISKAYVVKEWENLAYNGYQINSDIMIGNLVAKLTPKDARGIELSKYIVQYLSGYRGGRNETMMYGFSEPEENLSYYDYDMTSAYTTVMSILGHPDYSNAIRINESDVRKMELDPQLFLLSYTVLEVEFKFDESTKYPCIPARVDEDVDIYPLEGKSVITGPEYLVALSMGCKITVKDGVRIPFKGYKTEIEEKSSKHSSIIKKIKPLVKNRDIKETVDSQIEKLDEEVNKEIFDDLLVDDERGELVLSYNTPFSKIMRDLQSKRRMHEKKTFYNYMYKEIGNTVYGLVSMGLSGKTRYDAKSKSYLRVAGGVLSNPILAGYITGFCRAFIGECMNNIQTFGGSVVSVTTDGFITATEDLESKILTLKPSSRYCFSLYKVLRKLLTIDNDKKFDDSVLETKYIEKNGLMSWKTRGQMGLSEKGISAATGFQTKHYNKKFLTEMFSEMLNKSVKTFEFIQSGLRGAPDILKRGGHVMMRYKDQNYAIEYDNKRRIIENKVGGFYDTKPWNNVDEYSKIRILKKTISVPIYKGYTTQPSKGYKSFIETGVRGFIKVCLNDPVRFGIPKDQFPSYRSLIDFIHNFEPAKEVKLSLSSISHLKRRNTLPRSVPRTDENESFVQYVTSKIDTFNSDLFFRELSSEAIKARKKENKKNKVKESETNVEDSKTRESEQEPVVKEMEVKEVNSEMN